MIASTTEDGARFGPPRSLFHWLLVSKRLRTSAFVALALVGLATGAVLAAVLRQAQRQTWDQTCSLRAQLLASQVNDTVTFLGAVSGLLRAGANGSESARDSSRCVRPVCAAPSASPDRT